MLQLARAGSSGTDESQGFRLCAGWHVPCSLQRQVFLNIDLGELPGEPERLYALAHAANLACGGHAGDELSMSLALRRCQRHGARAGAHPSYPDREGFGRRPLVMPAAVLRDAVAAQCAELGRLAAALGVPLRHVKPHGALYHAAAVDAAVAGAVIEGALSALGPGLSVIGPAGSALADAARRAGLDFAREGFADRALRPDGSLVPRGEPGALLSTPEEAVLQTQRLLRSGEVDTLCVHGDSPGAVEIALAVRALIDQDLR